MKKLRFTVGFLVGGILFGSIGAAAASSTQMIEVLFGVKDVKINEASAMPDKPSFIYQGTTYVPLRYIAENLGSEVNWVPETQTIEIITPKAPPITTTPTAPPTEKEPTRSYSNMDVVGEWKSEFDVNRDRKDVDEYISSNFRIEALKDKMFKIVKGMYTKTNTYYDDSQQQKDMHAFIINWESKVFEMREDGSADIVIINRSSQEEVQAQFKIENGNIKITLAEDKNFDKFNLLPYYAKLK